MEQALAFVKIEQIVEILKEVERLKLMVLIRTSNDGKAVRGNIEKLQSDDNAKGIRISGISTAGMELLNKYDKIKIEFVLLAKKIYFITDIKARTSNKILVSFPNKIIALERRLNARYKIANNNFSFVNFQNKYFDIKRLDSPYIFKLNLLKEEKMPLISLLIDDVSLGGLACITYYQNIYEILKNSTEIIDAEIRFANMPHCKVPIIVRWYKKSILSINSDRNNLLQIFFTNELNKFNIKFDKSEINDTIYRIGFQFAEISNEFDSTIRTFIKDLQTEMAI